MTGARGATGAAGPRGPPGDAGRNGEPGAAGARVSLFLGQQQSELGLEVYSPS